MPFYEYQCTNCGHHEEVLQAISDKPLRKCPNCGKNGLKKLMSAPVFRLKGSGWYETDFKSDKDKQRNLAGSEKEEPKADVKADSAKTETPKAEAKPEPVKPAAEKASKSARKPAAARAKTKAKPARKARR
jgi:putative FmdB family regulatory protein